MLFINRVRAMVFNATFNNISVISWQSVLLVEETGVLGENHRPSVSKLTNYSLISNKNFYIVLYIT
jgi:hypothetical protein